MEDDKSIQTPVDTSTYTSLLWVASSIYVSVATRPDITYVCCQQCG